jgi:hypothetical protein
MVSWPKYRPLPLHFQIIIAGGISLALALGAASVTAGPPVDPGGSETGYDLGFADLSFGFKGGISLAQHVGIEERNADYVVSSTWRKGLAVGAFITFPVTSRLSMQQELLYVQKGSEQDIGVEILEIPTDLHVIYDMDYIEIPVFLRFAWLKSERSEFYSMAGTALSLKVKDRYRLSGEVTDGEEVIPLHADSDMSEVDMFDFSLAYGLGLAFQLYGRTTIVEYRFTMGWNTLAMPTYSYVPFGDDEILIENEPVPLKNQIHGIMIGIAF